MQKELTEFEKLFCENFVITLNASRAYKQTSDHMGNNCAISTARAHAHKYLKKPHLAAYIKKLKKEMADAMQICKEDLITELVMVAKANVTYFTKSMSLEDFNELPDDITAAIHSIKKITTTTPDGIERETIEVKLHDKMKAVEMLAKYLGFFEEHNKQKGTKEVRVKTAEKLDKTTLEAIAATINN